VAILKIQEGSSQDPRIDHYGTHRRTCIALFTRLPAVRALATRTAGTDDREDVLAIIHSSRGSLEIDQIRF
jgi:hypothetical protein